VDVILQTVCAIVRPKHPKTYKKCDFEGFWKDERSTSVSAQSPLKNGSKEAMGAMGLYPKPMGLTSPGRKSQAPSNPSRSQMSSKTASHLPWETVLLVL